MAGHRMRAIRHTWIQRHTFTGGFIPSDRPIADTGTAGTGLQVTRRLSMGDHYAHTLSLWQERFDGYTDETSALGFDSLFQHMWRFYPAYAGAGFRSGYPNVEQLAPTR